MEHTFVLHTETLNYTLHTGLLLHF